MKKRYLCATLFCAVIFSLALLLFSKLTSPKYANSSREGNLIAEYYRETDEGNRHDVIFVGDCEAYSAFVPPLIYEEYGIRSFVRGSPSQTIAQSYYLILDTLKYESPDAIVLSVYALSKNEPNKEAYNRMTLDGMRLSAEKIRAVYDSVGEDESIPSYFLPILRFHSRIYELEGEDIAYLFSRPRVSHNGYFMQKGIIAGEPTNYSLTAQTDPIPDENIDYLNKILDACREKEVELILVKSPTSSWRYPWYDEWDRQIEKYAEKNSLEYYNLIKYSGEIGIDLAADSYDGGFHLNVYGAEKTSSFFGSILSNRHGITGKTQDGWSDKLREYYKERNNEED